MTRAKQRLVLLGRWAARGRSGQRAPATGVSAAHSARATIDLLAAREPQPRDLAATMAELAVRPGECWRDDAGARWVFPALSSETAAAKRDWKGPALAAPASWADPAACAVASGRLREQRSEAELRMRRPLVSSATDEPVDDPEAAGFPLALAGGRPDEAVSPAKRDLAAAVGSAIHVLLERFDLEADPREEAAHQRACLVDLLAGRVDPDQLTAATRDAEAIWEQFTAGPLFRRFADLRARIVARELPVLAPPDDVGALGFTTGVIDLVYRDVATGELVVADYKTGGDADTARFAAQAGIYVRALGEALELERPPRFELWLLRQDEIVPIEAGHAHGEEGAPDGSAVE